MRKNSLGKDGLTQTSANHIANMAKEYYESLEAKIGSLRFLNRDYTLAVNGQTYRVENESDKIDLQEIPCVLQEIASLKALIAWLREAIKAKEDEYENGWERQLEELKRTDASFVCPKPEDMVTFEDVLAERSIDEKARYYSLEAKCATFGKCIHEKGEFALARKNYYDRQKNPTEIVGTGQDAEVNTYSSSFSSKDIDDQFFDIQKKYRSVQAELNKMKADIDLEVDERNKASIQGNQLAMEAYSSMLQAKEIEFKQEVKSLKIVVPESLKEICAKVSSLSSDK